LQARNTIPGQKETREDSRMERLGPGITYLGSCLSLDRKNVLRADGKAHFLRKHLFFSFSILFQYLKDRARACQGSGQDISKVSNRTSCNRSSAGEPEQTCKSPQPLQSCPVPGKETENLSTSHCSPSHGLRNRASFGQPNLWHLMGPCQTSPAAQESTRRDLTPHQAPAGWVASLHCASVSPVGSNLG